MKALTKRGFFSFFAGLPFVGAAFARPALAPDLDEYVDRRLKAIDGRLIERIACALAKSRGIHPDTLNRETLAWERLEREAYRVATHLGLVEFNIFDVSQQPLMMWQPADRAPMDGSIILTRTKIAKESKDWFYHYSAVRYERLEVRLARPPTSIPAWRETEWPRNWSFRFDEWMPLPEEFVPPFAMKASV